MVNELDVLAAAARIGPFVRCTPVEHSPHLSALTGCRVHLKLEHLQHTGSFKLRGATNKLLSLTPAELQRGVITASNGNHGIAVCHAARQFGVTPRVFMRRSVPEMRVALMRALGGEPIFFGDDPLAAEVEARAVAARTGRIFISPYNDAQVIAGQGTIGVELHQQLEHIDAVFVAVGGGGLISGIAAYLKAVRPQVRIIGCWPEHAPVLHECLRAGRIFACPERPTISDSTAGGVEADAITFELCRRLLDEHVLVSEAEIKQALRLLIEHERWIVEGAAGVALAAALQVGRQYTGGDVAVVLCGRNIAAEKLREVW